MIQRFSFLLAFGLIFLGRWFVTTQALSSSSSSFITLKDPLDGGIEQLPASYVSTWATWVYDYDSTWHQIPPQSSQDGFVSPTTFDELWQPVDLKYPDMQLALGVHVRNGQIRHVFPAVDLFYGTQKLHRNRGHCTVPRATEWTNFRLGVGGIESWVMTYHANKDSKNEDEVDPSSSSSSFWSIPIASTVSRIVEGLATDPPSELATGSHMVHVPLVEQEEDDFLTCPPVGQRLQVSLGSPLSMHKDNAGLDLAVVAAATGSQSDYLPDAYRPLYENVAFRRPEYQALRQKLDTNNIYKELLDQEEKQQ